MQSILQTILQTARGVGLIQLGMLVPMCVATGCQHAVNPFQDNLPANSEITTSSVEGARAAEVHPTIPQRLLYKPTVVEAQNGMVAHRPLCWEDPFEDKGSDDGQFAWTWEDYLAVGYGPGRNIGNTLLFPVTAVVSPPYTVMCSDGKLSRQLLGYDHDAINCPGGSPLPIDVLEVGTLQSPTTGWSNGYTETEAGPASGT